MAVAELTMANAEACVAIMHDCEIDNLRIVAALVAKPHPSGSGTEVRLILGPETPDMGAFEELICWMADQHRAGKMTRMYAGE